ncbi:unnamed protein product [Arctogadus glacialis]
MEEFNLHEIIASYPSDVIISEITFIETLRVPVQLRMKEFVFTDINKSSHHKLAAAKYAAACINTAALLDLGVTENQEPEHMKDAECERAATMQTNVQRVKIHNFQDRPQVSSGNHTFHST